MNARIGLYLTVLAPQFAFACPDMTNALKLSSTTSSAPPAFVVFDDLTVSEPFDGTVRFCTEAVDALEFNATMPAHQHGMNYIVDVTQIDTNSFALNNIVFHMPGLWEVRFDADMAEGRVSYSGTVEVP